MQTSLLSEALTSKDAERSLAALRLRLLDTLLERQGALFAVKEAASGVYLQVNDAMARWLGRDVHEVLGRTDAELLEPALSANMRAAEQTAQGQRTPLLTEHRFEWRGARHEFSVLRVVGDPDAQGRRLVAAVWTDAAPQRQKDVQLRHALEQLEEQQRANEQLRRELQDQTLRDQATGLYTRAHFDDQLKREVDLSTREHREFAVVFIALDPLPESAAGAAARVRVLEALGRLLRGNTRAMDASCRLEEDRFGVLLSGVGLATAHARMEGLRRQCATQIVMHDGRELGFSVSMGVASFPHTAHSEAELLDAGEKALAEAQRRGGNHVTLASIRFEG